jgi:prevent-host-death family protein
MTYAVPDISGISQFQRSPKTLFTRVKKTQKPLFITERSKVSGVVLDIKSYESLMAQLEQNENMFWAQAQEASFQDIWEHSSNDEYEKML